MISRRAFIGGLAGGLLVAPLAAEAQPTGTVYRLGVLCPTQCEDRTHFLWKPVTQGLRDFGWIEGQNFVFEFRSAFGKAAELPPLARELVSAKPDVIMAPSPAAAQALKEATRTIPIVFVGVADPVQSGFVASFAHPGGNMTGLTWISGPELDAKRLELLRQAVPAATRVAVLSIPTNEPYNTRALREVEAAARSLGVQLRRLDVQAAADLEPAFSTLAAERTAALLVLGSPLTLGQGVRIGDLAAKHRIPTMAVGRELMSVGYLLSYGASFADIYRRAGYYVDKILKGAKPADLPVEQPTKFELVINLKTAKALGLTIPQSLLLRADQVIE